MKRLSLQWRITLLTVLLIGAACVSMKLLLCASGLHYMDSIGSFIQDYGSAAVEGDPAFFDPELAGMNEDVTIVIHGAKTSFCTTNWYITAAVTVLSGVLAYFVSGRALKPLRSFASQVEKVQLNNLADMKIDEDVLPETAEFLTLLREQTERLTQMTRTLLEMSNLQQVARNERIQLAPMIEEIFTDLAPLSDKRGVTLTAEGDGIMTGSDALIYRLIFNLTENAVKYNRQGGSVRVSVTQKPEKLLLRVSDTGCGIPKEYQCSIFQPFFRVDKSRSREYGGAGLGLSLVWEIADLHGGSVWVEESSDKGTTIAVELPAQ